MKFAAIINSIKHYRWFILATTILLLFGLFVWPTPWWYVQTPDIVLRFNRLTGDVHKLTRNGWVKLRPPLTDAEIGLPANKK